MADIKMRDLLDLARADVGDPQGELKQLYAWKFEQMTTAAKATVGAGVSLIVAMTVALVQHHDGDRIWPLWCGLAGAVFIVGLGIWRHWRVTTLYREYVTAQSLLAEFIDIRPFLKRYGRTF